MTDQPTEGVLAVPIKSGTGAVVARRTLDAIPAVSVVESDRRRDAAVLAERNRCAAWVERCRLEHTAHFQLASIAAGIESGEPA